MTRRNVAVVLPLTLLLIGGASEAQTKKKPRMNMPKPKHVTSEMLDRDDQARSLLRSAVLSKQGRKSGRNTVQGELHEVEPQPFTCSEGHCVCVGDRDCNDMFSHVACTADRCYTYWFLPDIPICECFY